MGNNLYEMNDDEIRMALVDEARDAWLYALVNRPVLYASEAKEHLKQVVYDLFEADERKRVFDQIVIDVVEALDVIEERNEQDRRANLSARGRDRNDQEHSRGEDGSAVGVGENT